MANEIYRILRLDGGLVTDVSPRLLDPRYGYATDLRNLDLTAMGIPEKRPGTQEVLETFTNPIYGAHEYVKMSAPAIYKVVRAGTALLYWNSGGAPPAWVSITARTGTHFESMITFADKLIASNGFDNPISWNGTTVVNLALSDFPVCSHLGVFRNRIVAAGITGDPSLIHLSHTGDPQKWETDYDLDPSSNSWKGYISPDDGEGINGVLNMGDSGLLIGKPTALYGLFGYTRNDFTIDLLDPTVGAGSHDAMVFVRPYAYFPNRLGIFRFQFGGQPERISDPIQSLYKQLVDTEVLHKARAIQYNRFYIVTLPTKSTGWVTFAYHIDRESWALWDHPVLWAPLYVDAGGPLYYGEHGGTILKRLTPGTYKDGDQAINGMLELREFDVEIHEVEKDFKDLYLTCLTAEDTYTVSVWVNPDGTGWALKAGRVRIEGPPGKQRVVRVPVAKTARFLGVRIINNELDQDLRPISITVVYSPRGLL